MLVILVSLPSAVVAVGKGVVGAIKIVVGFFCRVCGTGLPGVGLVVAMTSLAVVIWWMAMGGGFALFVP